MLGYAILPLVASTAAYADVPVVDVPRRCLFRAEPTHESALVVEGEPDSRWALLQVGEAPWGWVRVQGPTGDMWVGPECEWRVTTARECPSVAQAACAEPAPAPLVAPHTVEAPTAERPSFGGVFLGRAGTSDPYLGEGGQLSVGGIALLRVRGSGWMAGFSAAYLGGSRFEREIKPFVPELEGGGRGIGNVASIYTDVRHLPFAALSAYGWELWRVEFILGAGPSAHRFAVRRREQVSGVKQEPPVEVRDGAEQQEFTTYTIDREFTGSSARWALGGTAVAGALIDAGTLPFIGGHWRFGVLATLSSPLGRQGCAGANTKDGSLQFGTVCIPLAFTEIQREYYTGGKEDTDQTTAFSRQQVMPVQGLTWSINSTLLFQF
jgi:hypothetical protein